MARCGLGFRVGSGGVQGLGFCCLGFGSSAVVQESPKPRSQTLNLKPPDVSKPKPLIFTPQSLLGTLKSKSCNVLDEPEVMPGPLLRRYQVVPLPFLIGPLLLGLEV